MAKKTVLLGMSGGIDSSMSVLLLKEKGYEVIGATFLLAPSDGAKHVAQWAQQLGIAHLEIDVSKIFQKNVVGYFTNEYLKGRTPSPCVFCNPTIKFPFLMEKAQSMGIGHIATGHYVSKTQCNGLYYIQRGADTVKDQSYYLWKLDQEILQKTLFPLGGRTKGMIKEMARQQGFGQFLSQKESMGVCFLKNRNYRDVIENLAPLASQKIGTGQVCDLDGKVIGQHDGYPYYTIGQKSGLQLNQKGPLYVHSIDPAGNIIYVADKKRLETNTIAISHLFCHNPNDFNSEKLQVMVRGLGLNPSGHARIQILEKGHAMVHLESPAWAIAPGQPVVFYVENRVVGGGIAEKG
jgi:tRNA-uridine 2-sulfurtransferase